VIYEVTPLALPLHPQLRFSASPGLHGLRPWDGALGTTASPGRGSAPFVHHWPTRGNGWWPFAQTVPFRVPASIVIQWPEHLRAPAIDPSCVQ